MSIKRNSGKQTGKTKFRFYRSHLPAIVWDPEKGKKMADFTAGHFITSDLRIAEILLDKGYPQIPIDAVTPPDIIMALPGKSLQEGENISLVGENETVPGKPVLIPLAHEE